MNVSPGIWGTFGRLMKKEHKAHQRMMKLLHRSRKAARSRRAARHLGEVIRCMDAIRRMNNRPRRRPHV